MGVSSNERYFFGVPYNKDHGILGSILGSAYLGKLPSTVGVGLGPYAATGSRNEYIVFLPLSPVVTIIWRRPKLLNYCRSLNLLSYLSERRVQFPRIRGPTLGASP